MAKNPNNPLGGALCALKKFQNSDYNWFPEPEEFVEELNARSVCFSCPVQKTCAQTALDSREAWGVWGGMEEFRMRRALGMDSFENNRIYSRDLICPFCGSDDLTKAKKKNIQGYPVQCNSCEIHWNSYRIPDKVRKTLRRQHDSNVGRSVEEPRE